MSRANWFSVAALLISALAISITIIRALKAP